MVRLTASVLHAAFWRTWWAKACTAVSLLLAVAPRVEHADLVDWLARQAPFLPSWAHAGVATGIVVARIAVALRLLAIADSPEDRRRR